MTPVVYIHDGAIDEYMAAVLLTTMPDVELQGIILVNGDCIAGPAMQAGWRIQSFLGSPVPLALSSARAWSQFPWEFRGDCLLQASVAALAPYPPNQDWPWAWYPTPSASLSRASVKSDKTDGFPSGEDLLSSLLRAAVSRSSPVTVVVCCGLTPLRSVLEADPSLAAGVSRLVWTGGSINGVANFAPVPPQVVSPFTEWNAWWDADSVAWIFSQTTFPFVMIPSDLTDSVPLSTMFLASLQAQAATKRYSQLAYQSYNAVVSTEPAYRMWNTVTAAYLEHPEFFDTPSSMTLSMITEGYFQGVLLQDPAGRAVQVHLNMADLNGFYSYLLAQFNR